MNRIKEAFQEYRTNRKEFWYRFMRKYCGKWMPDTVYLTLLWRLYKGEWLNIKHPKTFEEKLQWLKIYDRKPEYTTMVDKFAVKEYVSKKIGAEFVIPTLGVWDKPEDINFDTLPNQFVLKPTHGAGGTEVVICKNKALFNKKEALLRLKKGMMQDSYRSLREWPYKNVPRRIIAEKYVSPTQDSFDLPDYKWYCFGGVPKFCQVIQNRSTKETIDFFDTQWHHQDFIGLNPRAIHADKKVNCPVNLSTHLWIASELSKGIPFSRIDLYDTGKNVFFGEITFFPTSGMGAFSPQKYDEIIGDMLNLPEIIFK